MQFLIQLIATLIGMAFTATAGWAAKYGVENDDWKAIGAGLGLAAGTAIVGALYKRYLRRLDPPDDTTGTGSGFSGNTLAILLLPALLISQIGCTSSVSKQVIAGQQTLAVTMHALADARDAGLLTQAQVNQVKPYIDAMIVALFDAEQAVKRGDKSQAQIYLQAFQKANAKLLEWRARTLSKS